MQTKKKSITKTGYFHEVARNYGTQFWINNPTLKEASDAIEAGACCATTNPTYVARLLREEPDYAASLIDEAVAGTDDDDDAADGIVQRAIARVAKSFEPVFERSNGCRGLVAIQGDPRLNDDPEEIIQGAKRYRPIGKNILLSQNSVGLCHIRRTSETSWRRHQGTRGSR